jgi:hypothetical protein
MAGGSKRRNSSTAGVDLAREQDAEDVVSRFGSAGSD